MSYLPRHQPLEGVTDVATAVTKVAQDPCLFKVTEMVLLLNALEQPKVKPGGPPPPPVPGIGLCSAVKPLSMVLYVKQRPWILPVAGIAVVGALVGLGYLLGGKR